MSGITGFLVEKFIPRAEELPLQEKRARYGFLEAWVSILGNTFLALIKFFLGFAFNSIALIADAVHTASDVITSVIVLVGFRAARAPADKEHPFGHGRVETIATLIIAVLLAIVGVEFARTSITRLTSNDVARGSWTVALIMVGGALFKEWMASFSLELGKKINSSVLVADAWHHRSDAIASALVAIAMVGTAYGFGKLDAIFGFLVSALIIYTGWDLGKDAVSSLIGEAPDESFVKQVHEVVKRVHGLRGMHKLQVHDYGGDRRFLSMHILVDPRLPIREANAIARSVMRALEEELHVAAVVHVEPSGDVAA